MVGLLDVGVMGWVSLGSGLVDIAAGSTQSQGNQQGYESSSHLSANLRRLAAVQRLRSVPPTAQPL